MAVLRLFAGAREAAGTGRDEVPGATVGEVLDAARDALRGRRSPTCSSTAQIWRNGEPCELDEAVGDGDEVAVLPPVSGGAALMATRQAGRSRPRPDGRRQRVPSVGPSGRPRRRGAGGSGAATPWCTTSRAPASASGCSGSSWPRSRSPSGPSRPRSCTA